MNIVKSKAKMARRAPSKVLDLTDMKILRELKENARIAYAELGRRIGLSTPAVMERMRRLEDAGVIIGYSVRVNMRSMGYPIAAFIALHNVDATVLSRIARIASSVPEMLECHRVTGDNSYLIKTVAASVEDLERIIDRLSPFAATSTSVVLSTVIEETVPLPRGQKPPSSV